MRSYDNIPSSGHLMVFSPQFWSNLGQIWAKMPQNAQNEAEMG